jgi:transposase
VQRRVITEAKAREERGWLAEVASVALVQSVRDAHRAYRNFTDSVSGKRKGGKVGRPRLKSRKDNRQSFRLTRSGFSVKVRAWTCPACQSAHDRDHNAAINILAAGRAERQNACGARVSPPSREALGDEAGSTPDAA